MSLLPTSRDRKAAQTRSNLSEAAIALFREHGVEQVTIDDICTRCGVTKGAFYHHFSSKDYIVTYSINHELDRYIQANFQYDPELSVSRQLLTLQQLAFSYFRRLGKEMTRYSYEGQVRSLIELKLPERSYVRYLSEIIRTGIDRQCFRSRLDFENCYMMNIIIFTGFLFKWSSTSEETDLVYRWDDILRELILPLFQEAGDGTEAR